MTKTNAEAMAENCLKENCVDWKQRPDIKGSITQAILAYHKEASKDLVEALEKISDSDCMDCQLDLLAKEVLDNHKKRTEGNHECRG